MNYYILRHQYAPGAYVDGDVEFEPSITGYYKAGAPIDLVDRRVSVRLDKLVRKLKVDFFHTTNGAFFASTPLATVIASHQRNLVFVPANVTYHNGKPAEQSFSLVHANDRVDCFDYQESVYAGKPLILQRLERGEDPSTVPVKVPQSISIDEARAIDQHFFFLKNVALVDPVISEVLAKPMQAGKFVVRLEPAETQP